MIKLYELGRGSDNQETNYFCFIAIFTRKYPVI